MPHAINNVLYGWVAICLDSGQKMALVASNCVFVGLQLTLVLTISLSESIMETCSVVLTFESVDEILWCDHSNETSSAVLLQWYHLYFNILQNKIWDFS